MSQSKVLLRSRKKTAFARIQEGRFAEAKAIIQDICRANGRDAEAWFLLGAVNGQLKLYDEAMDCCRKAIDLNPDYADAHYNLAQACMHQKRWEEAVSAYRHVIRLQPNHAEAHNALGLALENLGRIDEAMRRYRETLRLQPQHADAYYNLGNVLPYFDDTEKSVECYQQALRHRPDFVKVFINLGFALHSLGRLDEAQQAFQRVQALEPDNSDAVFGIAAVHEKKGEFDLAYSLLRPFLDAGIDNEHLAATFASVARHVDRRADAIALLQRVLLRPDLKPADTQPLHYQLGKLHDELKEYDKAFFHFQRANSLAPAYSYCSPEEHLRQMDAAMAFFTPEFFARAPRASNTSARPIFIVGMPRSGTTLTEQILASHPEAYGGGELKDIGKIIATLPGLLGSAQPYPQCLDKLDQKILDVAAERYLAKLATLSPNAARVTDKMPHNFKHLGLIALMFPLARIIHCQRDPMDNCLSIYTLSFSPSHSYATDLTRLGEHYREYQQLMEHWKTVLPIPMLEVRYEEMVAEPERVSRELI
ncbi:MAG: tetratricopeptide repeat protein, partial [Gallionella sp.]|nr:tetratricopeptide repeat protein [Gallionella sp.]